MKIDNTPLFIKSGENTTGPISIWALVKLIDEKSLSEDDLLAIGSAPKNWDNLKSIKSTLAIRNQIAEIKTIREIPVQCIIHKIVDDLSTIKSDLDQIRDTQNDMLRLNKKIEELVDRTREIKLESERIKWAARGIALLLAVIVFFGLRLK